MSSLAPLFDDPAPLQALLDDAHGYSGMSTSVIGASWAFLMVWTLLINQVAVAARSSRSFRGMDYTIFFGELAIVLRRRRLY